MIWKDKGLKILAKKKHQLLEFKEDLQWAIEEFEKKKRSDVSNDENDDGDSNDYQETENLCNDESQVHEKHTGMEKLTRTSKRKNTVLVSKNTDAEVTENGKKKRYCEETYQENEEIDRDDDQGSGKSDSNDEHENDEHRCNDESQLYEKHTHLEKLTKTCKRKNTALESKNTDAEVTDNGKKKRYCEETYQESDEINREDDQESGKSDSNDEHHCNDESPVHVHEKQILNDLARYCIENNKKDDETDRDDDQGSGKSDSNYEQENDETDRNGCQESGKSDSNDEQEIDEVDRDDDQGSGKSDSNHEHENDETDKNDCQGSSKSDGNNEQEIDEIDRDDDQGSGRSDSNDEQENDETDRNGYQGSGKSDSNHEHENDETDKNDCQGSSKSDSNNEQEIDEIDRDDDQGSGKSDSNDEQEIDEVDRDDDQGSCKSDSNHEHENDETDKNDCQGSSKSDDNNEQENDEIDRDDDQGSGKSGSNNDQENDELHCNDECQFYETKTTKDIASEGKIQYVRIRDNGKKKKRRKKEECNSDCESEEGNHTDYDEMSEENESDGYSDNEDVSMEKKQLDEETIMRDVNIPGIYIKKYRVKKERNFRGQSKNTRIYDNFHACYFCGKVVLHINMHLKTHRNKKEVKEIMKSEKPNFTALRKLGDDKHNRQSLETGKGEIILARRSRTNDAFDITQYGPCPNCNEWMQLKGLKSHNRECTKHLNAKTCTGKRYLVIQSQILAGHIKTNPSPNMLKEVFTIMTPDEITKTAQEDPLILSLGESWLKRNVGNTEKRKYYASGRMRLCARLLLQLRLLLQKETAKKTPGNDSDKEKEKQKTMWEFLKPQHFDDVVLASLKCSYPEADDNEDLLSPSNCIKLKYDIQRLINSKWAFIIKKSGDENHPEAKEAKAFLGLMDVEWKERVATIARSVLNFRKYEEVKELPSPADIEALTTYLSTQLQKSALYSPQNFSQVVVLAQTRLLCYNKRRTGELEVIKLQSYASRSQGLDNLDETLAKDLSEVEKHLIESQDLMKVRGKRGRPVPVIIPSDAKQALAFLADRKIRREAGILQENMYLFPNSVKYYARAYDSLKTICSKLNLVAPHRITSVSMRKYTATLTQVLNLDKYQMEWIYNHLGHTKAVHKEHYRQMSGLIERTHISKILPVQDLNLTAKFKGKKLEDIDITDVVFHEDAVLEENEDADNSGSGQNHLSVKYQ